MPRNSRRSREPPSQTEARGWAAAAGLVPAFLARLIAASLIFGNLGCTTRIVSFSQNDGAGITLQEGGAVPPDAGQSLDRRPDQQQDQAGAMDAQGGDSQADVAAPDRQIPDALPDRPQQPPLYRYVEYVCCKMDVSNECVTAFMGSAALCADTAHWKDSAHNDCNRQGALLADYFVYLDCSSELVAPGSAPAPRCFYAEKRTENMRCLVCDDGAGAVTQYCEVISCTTVQADPAMRCDQCRWSRQPSVLCDVCYDQTTGTTRDTCYGQKAPE